MNGNISAYDTNAFTMQQALKEAMNVHYLWNDLNIHIL